MPEDVLERTFAESAKFFKRPRGEKDALAWTTPEVCFLSFFLLFWEEFDYSIPAAAAATEAVRSC